MLVVDTQYMENYGVHGWDGQGEVPQHWKFKGGSSYKIVGAPTHMDPVEIVKLLDIEYDEVYSKEFVISTHWESEDWLSPFERDQLDYDGEILHPEVVIDFEEVVTSND